MDIARAVVVRSRVGQNARANERLLLCARTKWMGLLVGLRRRCTFKG